MSKKFAPFCMPEKPRGVSPDDEDFTMEVPVDERKELEDKKESLRLELWRNLNKRDVLDEKKKAGTLSAQEREELTKLLVRIDTLAQEINGTDVRLAEIARDADR